MASWILSAIATSVLLRQGAGATLTTPGQVALKDWEHDTKEEEGSRAVCPVLGLQDTIFFADATQPWGACWEKEGSESLGSLPSTARGAITGTTPAAASDDDEDGEDADSNSNNSNNNSTKQRAQPPPKEPGRTSAGSISKFYQILPSPDKGGGLGVFARTLIPRGTQLMLEPPLFAVVPPAFHPGRGYDMGEMLEGIGAAVEQLGEEDRAVFEECWEHLQDGEEEEEEEEEENERKQRRGGSDKLQRHMRIFRTNAYMLPDGRSAMFPLVARINHSCAPNAANVWDPQAQVRVIWASRDIQAGEEVLVSYAPLLQDTESRRERLRQYGFECGCDVCREDDDDAGSAASGKKKKKKEEDATRRRLGRDLSELEAAAAQETTTTFMSKRLAKQAGKLAAQLRDHGQGELWGYLEQVYELAAVFWERAGDEGTAGGFRAKAGEMRVFGTVVSS
ncbi:uncharacterized protein B0I36DRAFT_361244 [Microdochium trichocladiopsis]|uniref:SET domain-containing protein n=1 Tax=Microdochium trichocladiopsis TaxID=1682393 RepID=A0A9P8YCF9_9PEZI|nr:uncharacterized protein B0I36DRAFT_361244 [Microdochium trichocladiopsis]KAH7035933.1 hypothetical protein B0I36DRAFT_361244 [Microdochium trichocladiopsis]